MAEYMARAGAAGKQAKAEAEKVVVQQPEGGSKLARGSSLQTIPELPDALSDSSDSTVSILRRVI